MGTDEPAIDRFVRPRRLTGTLRGPQPHRAEADQELGPPRRLTGTGPQFQGQAAHGLRGADRGQDKAQALIVGGIEDDAVLGEADHKSVILFTTRYQVFIDISLAVGDAYPADRLIARGRPDPRRGGGPALRFAVPEFALLRRIVGFSLGPAPTDQVLLIDQPQDLDRAAPAGGVGLSAGAARTAKTEWRRNPCPSSETPMGPSPGTGWVRWVKERYDVSSMSR